MTTQRTEFRRKLRDWWERPAEERGFWARVFDTTLAIIFAGGLLQVVDMLGWLPS